ncbi:MAG TPA: undecaprenyl/decaprenyl-phosphate alpha-N-acetylglucosaminyl 1-phosphate transferase [Acidimicrobiaceae bacterium]|nr:undecaprenyl/decaprenyl-phosphate alpha-N-acetylglucosaminyl 1-phosphate transferase [Acidimicrobiaceae bacterium]
MIAAYLTVLAASAGTTFALVPLCNRLAHRWGAIAIPSDRRVHTSPTPALGGAAMFVGLIVGIVVASRVGQFGQIFESRSNIVGTLAAAFLIFWTGAVDDVREVTAPAKMAGMVLAGSVLSLSGVSIVNLPLPLLGFTVLSPDLAALVTVIWVVVMANAVNFLDGLDGLAAGVMAIAAGAFLLYSVNLDRKGLLFDGNPGPLIAVIVLGLCCGFLPWNFHPAKTFMGDSGALLLGLLLAASTIAVGGQSDASFTGQSWFFFAPLVIPLLILGIPLGDMVFAILRRATRRSGLATADKDHLHHRLLRLGHGHRQSVVILWMWTAILSAFALYPAFTQRSTLMLPIALAGLALLLFTLLAPWFGRRRGSDADDDSEDHEGSERPGVERPGVADSAGLDTLSEERMIQGLPRTGETPPGGEEVTEVIDLNESTTGTNPGQTVDQLSPRKSS